MPHSLARNTMRSGKIARTQRHPRPATETGDGDHFAAPTHPNHFGRGNLVSAKRGCVCGLSAFGHHSHRLAKVKVASARARGAVDIKRDAEARARRADKQHGSQSATVTVCSSAPVAPPVKRGGLEAKRWNCLWHC